MLFDFIKKNAIKIKAAGNLHVWFEPKINLIGTQFAVLLFPHE